MTNLKVTEKLICQLGASSSYLLDEIRQNSEYCTEVSNLEKNNPIVKFLNSFDEIKLDENDNVVYFKKEYSETSIKYNNGKRTEVSVSRGNFWSKVKYNERTGEISRIENSKGYFWKTGMVSELI